MNEATREGEEGWGLDSLGVAKELMSSHVIKVR